MSRYKYQGTMKDGNGRVIGSATTSDGNPGTITVYLVGTDTLADVYVASAGGSAVNFVSTDEHGYFYFWVDTGDYASSQQFKIICTHSDFRAQLYDDLIIFPGTGAGGGINNVVEDLTPQLGGDLDMNSHNVGGNTEAQIDAAVAGTHTQGTDTTLGTQAENLNMGTHKIVGVIDPTTNQEAATKKYVDDHGGGINNIVEDTTPQLGGNLDMNGFNIGGNTEVQIDDAVTKKHTQGSDTALGTQAENLDMGTHKIVNVVDPTANQDALTKKYFDDNGNAVHDLVGAKHTVSSLTPGHVLTAITATTFGFTATAGGGDVLGPATNTDDYVPQWDGADSKLLKNGFIITAAGKALIDDANAAAMHGTLGLGTVAVRNVRDALMVDDETVPDGNAIITYGDANWGVGYTNLTSFVDQTAWRVFYSNNLGDVTELALGADGTYLKSNGAAAAPTFAVPGGAGDVLGPGSHAADYVPQWNGVPDSKTLIEGFAITTAGKAILDDADAAAQRTTLGLGTAATRAAEDVMTDGANLPDGAAIKTYGEANWGGDSLWTDYPASNYIQPNNQSNIFISDTDAYEMDLLVSRAITGSGSNIYKAAQFNLTNDGTGATGGIGWTIYTEIDNSSAHTDGSVALYAKAITQSGAGWTTACHGEVHDRQSSGVAIAGNFEMWNKHPDTAHAYGVISGVNAWSGAPATYYNGHAAYVINTNTGKQWRNGIEFRGHTYDDVFYPNCTDYELRSDCQLRMNCADGLGNVQLYAANIMKKTGTSCDIGTSANYFNNAYINFVYCWCGLAKCDHVFEDNYKLMSLDHLEDHLGKTHALPDMTTNRGRNKLDIGKATEELLIKVEEQTLYILQLHNRIKEIEYGTAN